MQHQRVITHLPVSLVLLCDKFQGLLQSANFCSALLCNICTMAFLLIFDELPLLSILGLVVIYDICNCMCCRVTSWFKYFFSPTGIKPSILHLVFDIVFFDLLATTQFLLNVVWTRKPRRFY